MKRLTIVLAGLIVLAVLGYFGSGYAIDRALESKGLRKLIAGKTAKLLDCNAGYAALRSNGLWIASAGFLAKAPPPRALTEMRAARLQARCNLRQLWHGKWRIENLWVDHLQGAYGEDAAQKIDRKEFADPELLPRLETESPLEVDLRRMTVARTDLFWGRAPDAGGEFRGVHTVFFPQEKNLVVHGSGGTFRQAKWPVAQVQQFKLFYAKPDLRIDEALLSMGGQSSIRVLGNFRFEKNASFDLQLAFAHCPIAPFLGDNKPSKLEGEFDGTSHLQKEIGQTESAGANGSITVTKAVLQKIAALEHAATFTGRPELARLPIDNIKAEYDWNWPTLTVKNFVLESNGRAVVKGEFVMKEQKIDGEFELGVAPDLVEKFPGAREEIFTRRSGDYLWTKWTISGTTQNLREDLKPRLIRAAQSHFSKGLLAPIFKPGQTVIEAIEEL